MFKNRKITTLILLSAVCYLSSNLYAADSKTGTTTASFLKIETGARPTAMGGAFAAVSDDLNALYYNPAGLAQLDSRAFSAVHTLWLQSINHDYVAFGFPITLMDNKLAFGIHAVYLGVDDIDRRTSAGVSDGQAKVADLAVAGTVAWQLRDTTNLGFTVKGIRMAMDKSQDNGFALDAGILEKLPDNLAVGLMVQNLGPKMDVSGTKEKLPTNLKAGLSYRMFNNNLLLATDVNFPNDRNMRFHGGAEYRFNKLFALRTGYEDVNSPGNSSGFTAGISVNEDYIDEILNVKMQFDYAWMSFGELGSTHRLEIGIKF